MSACPCGSGDPYAGCCGLYHDGLPAPTALALMRSRYCAFVKNLVDYLLETHDPDTVKSVSRASLAQFARDTMWLGLEIVATERGGETDETGIVEFIARGASRGQPFAQRERSRFRKLEDRWVYIDGVVERV
jgi:SEC-C motif-containing protein